MPVDFVDNSICMLMKFDYLSILTQVIMNEYLFSINFYGFKRF